MPNTHQLPSEIAPASHFESGILCYKQAERTCLSREDRLASDFKFQTKQKSNSSTTGLCSRMLSQAGQHSLGSCQGRPATALPTVQVWVSSLPRNAVSFRYPFNFTSSLNSQSQSLFLQPRNLLEELQWKVMFYVNEMLAKTAPPAHTLGSSSWNSCSVLQQIWSVQKQVQQYVSTSLRGRSKEQTLPLISVSYISPVSSK